MKGAETVKKLFVLIGAVFALCIFTTSFASEPDFVELPLDPISGQNLVIFFNGQAKFFSVPEGVDVIVGFNNGINDLEGLGLFISKSSYLTECYSFWEGTEANKWQNWRSITTTFKDTYYNIYPNLIRISNISGWEIVYQNCVIKNVDGSHYSGNLPPPINANSDLKILLPRDGFKQSKLNAIVMTVQFTNIPYDGNDQLNWGITGYREDRPKEGNYQSFDVSSDGTKVSGFLKIEGAVNWNTETILNVSLTDYLGGVHNANITVTCFDDFVDVNGDGLDDRTGQDEWNGTPDYGGNSNISNNAIGDMPKREDFPEGWNGDIQFGFAFLIWIITYPFKLIATLFTTVIQVIKDLFVGFEEFISMIKPLISWLPPQLVALIVLGFGFVILKLVLKR